MIYLVWSLFPSQHAIHTLSMSLHYICGLGERIGLYEMGTQKELPTFQTSDNKKANIKEKAGII